MKAILSKTPAFLDSLRAAIEALKPKPEAESGDTADEDPALLRERLLAVKAACEEYDEASAEKIVRELRKKTWSKPARDLLNAISEQLLHSDFDEIAEAVGRFVETS